MGDSILLCYGIDNRNYAVISCRRILRSADGVRLGRPTPIVRFAHLTNGAARKFQAVRHDPLFQLFLQLILCIPRLGIAFKLDQPGSKICLYFRRYLNGLRRGGSTVPDQLDEVDPLSGRVGPSETGNMSFERPILLFTTRIMFRTFPTIFNRD